jgi:hypothetical protein
MSKFIIVIRQTVDWLSMTPQKFINQSKISQKRYDAILIWDKLFKISYFQFRQRCKNLAFISWSNVACCDIILTNSNLLTNIVDNLDDDWCVAYTDDDDWYNGRLAESVLPHIKDYDAIYWNHTRYQTCPYYPEFLRNKQPLFGYGVKNFFGTNGYAITRSGWEKLRKDRREKNRHEIVTSWFLKNDKMNTLKLDERLSISNKNLCSATTLDWINNNCIDIEEDLLSYREWAEKDIDIPDKLKWSEPLILEMQRLYRECL